MRILSLATANWGAVQLEELQLTTRGRIQIIYGENEAGKSTTMRAIRALVRGLTDVDPVPRPIHDAVVRADVELNGQSITVERRGANGPGTAPRTPNGAPVPWPAVDRDHYDKIICIDHAVLRAGGSAMLRSDGELGSVLLRSIVDGERLDRLLGATRGRLDALFNPAPQARRKRLNGAVAALKDAVDAIEDGAVNDVDFERLRRQHDEAVDEHQQARLQRQAIDRERQDLTTLVSLAPIVEQLDRWESELESLRVAGPVPDAAAAQALEAARAHRDTAHAHRNAAAAALAEAEANLGALPHDAEALALDATFKEAETGYDQHVAVAAAAPELEAALAKAEDAWRCAAPADGGALPSPQASTALRTALDRWRKADEAATEAQARCAGANEALEQARAARQAAPALTDDDEKIQQLLISVRATLTQWSKIEARAVQVASKEADLRRDAAVLGLSGDAGAIGMLAAPDSWSRAEWQQDWKRADDKVTAATQAVHSAQADLAKADAEVERFAPPLHVPDEATLQQKRASRDDAIRATCAGTGPGRDVVEVLVREADVAADLRFAASDALARRAGAEHEREKKRGAVDDAKATLAADETERARLEAAWAEDARRRGLPAWPLKILDSSLKTFDALRTLLATIEALRVELNRERDEAAAALNALRAALGEPDIAVTQTALESTIGAAAKREERRAAAAKTLAGLDSAIAHHQQTVDKLQQEVSTAEVRRAEARQAWANLAVEFGAPSSTSLDLAEAWFEAIVHAVAARAEHDKAAAAVSASRASLEAYEQRTAPLLQLLDGNPAPAERVQRVRERVEKARKAAVLREELTRVRHKAAAEHDKCHQLAEAANAAWTHALAGAGLASDADVEPALVRAKTAHSHLDSIHKARQALGVHDPDSLRKRIAGRDVPALNEARADADRRFAEATTKVDEAARQVAAATANIEKVNGGDTAAVNLQAATSHAAATRDLLRDLIKERAAAWMLEKLHESLSQAAHGPVARAGEIFAELTAGSFAGLEVKTAYVDNKQVRHIVGRRPSNELLGPKAMSDGTQDSLWLALRFAAIEAEADAGRRLPVVLDDVAVHLSDMRTERVLAACNALAAKTQVLLFTHHRSIVTLAKDKLPGCEIVELRPRPANSPPVPRDAPPPEAAVVEPGAKEGSVELSPSGAAPRGAAARANSIDDATYEAVVDVVRQSGTANKSSIVGSGHCSEDQWDAVRARLENDARILADGRARGRRYVWRASAPLDHMTESEDA
jgi:uncharacterized protein YhaN